MQKSIENEGQMAQFAEHVWSEYGANRSQAVVFALEGELGAGKTTFTKAVARAAGITDMVVSPTFVLHREYSLFDHIDAWRIEKAEELAHLGIQKMLQEKHVVVIEWADKFRSWVEELKSSATVVWLKFEHGTTENERSVSYENLSH